MSTRRPAPPGVGPRAALATVAIMAGTLVAHSWAGGTVPSSPWLVGVTALVFAASVGVFRGVVSGPVMFVALAAAQLGLHGALVLLAGSSAHGAGAHHMAGSPSMIDLFSMDPRMALAHTVSAGLTALMWAVVARAIDVLVRVPEHAGLRVERRMAPGGWVTAPSTVQAFWLTGAPRRGPPYALSPSA